MQASKKTVDLGKDQQLGLPKPQETTTEREREREREKKRGNKLDSTNERGETRTTLELFGRLRKRCLSVCLSLSLSLCLPGLGKKQKRPKVAYLDTTRPQSVKMWA
jgi:hypothetical protein